MDIEQLVMIKYPVTELEKTCRTEREFKRLMRQEYRTKLLEQQKANERQQEDRSKV